MSAQQQQPGDSPAALALRRIMEQISEQRWAAGWYSGLEHILWRWMTGTNAGVLSSEERAVLRWLSEQAGGWWTWPKGEPEPVFLSTQEWGRLYQEKGDGIRQQAREGPAPSGESASH